jgi:hypothetical protein
MIDREGCCARRKFGETGTEFIWQLSICSTVWFALLIQTGPSTHSTRIALQPASTKPAEQSSTKPISCVVGSGEWMRILIGVSVRLSWTCIVARSAAQLNVLVIRRIFSRMRSLHSLR